MASKDRQAFHRSLRLKAGRLRWHGVASSAATGLSDHISDIWIWSGVFESQLTFRRWLVPASAIVEVQIGKHGHMLQREVPDAGFS